MDNAATDPKPKTQHPPPASLWDLPAEVFAPRLFNARRGRPVFLIDRFWDRVPVGDGCWLWPGEARTNGYGLFEVEWRPPGRAWRRVRFRAHRFAWESIHEPIPAGLFVLHRCDCRRCCRPDHLFLGTNRDNAHDMMRKGRGKRAKLTADQVREVRRRLAGGESKASIAGAMNVTRRAVRDIRCGVAYAWVPEEVTDYAVCA